MCVAAPRSWSPPGSGWQSSPLLTATESWEPVAHQACGSDLNLPQFQGCRYVAEGSCPAGVKRWGVGRQCGTASRGQQSSWGLADPGVLPPQALRLRKPDGQVWCVLESSNPGATPEGSVLLAAGGEQTRQESQAREGSRQKSRSVPRLLQAPRPSNPRLPRREATLPPTRRGHSLGVGGYSSSLGLNNHGSLGDLHFRTPNYG